MAIDIEVGRYGCCCHASQVMYKQHTRRHHHHHHIQDMKVSTAHKTPTQVEKMAVISRDFSFKPCAPMATTSGIVSRINDTTLEPRLVNDSKQHQTRHTVVWQTRTTLLVKVNTSTNDAVSKTSAAPALLPLNRKTRCAVILWCEINFRIVQSCFVCSVLHSSRGAKLSQLYQSCLCGSHGHHSRRRRDDEKCRCELWRDNCFKWKSQTWE